MKGQVIMLGNGPATAVIWLWSTLLDLAAAERLNMEGEPTGQHIHFRPSALRPGLPA